MVMWKFKSCPRCGGDIFVDRDLDGWREQCLQCGYLGAVLSADEVPKHNHEREGETVPAVQA